ncbi:YncE family protein [Roseobacter sp. A03A-229]
MKRPAFLLACLTFAASIGYAENLVTKTGIQFDNCGPQSVVQQDRGRLSSILHVACISSREIMSIDLATSVLIGRVKLAFEPLVLNSDGRFLIAVGRDDVFARAEKIDFATGESVSSLQTPLEGWEPSISLIHRGLLFLNDFNRSVIRVIDVNSLIEVAEIRHFKGPVIDMDVLQNDIVFITENEEYLHFLPIGVIGKSLPSRSANFLREDYSNLIYSEHLGFSPTAVSVNGSTIAILQRAGFRLLEMAVEEFAFVENEFVKGAWGEINRRPIEHNRTKYSIGRFIAEFFPEENEQGNWNRSLFNEPGFVPYAYFSSPSISIDERGVLAWFPFSGALVSVEGNQRPKAAYQHGIEVDKAVVISSRRVVLIDSAGDRLIIVDL